MTASRACNYLQNAAATTYKKFLQFYAKRSCKKHSSPLRVVVIHYNSHAIFDRLEFFTPRCQFRQLFIGHIFTRSVLQQKFKISVNVQPMCFGHLNHCVDYCAGIRSVHGTAEQPVFSPHCEWTDRILGGLSLYEDKPVSSRSVDFASARRTGSWSIRLRGQNPAQ